MEHVEPQSFHSKSWSAEHRGSEMSYGRFFPQPVAAWMALNQPSAISGNIVRISWEYRGFPSISWLHQQQGVDFSAKDDGRMFHQQSTRSVTIKMIPLDNHQEIPVYGGMYQENGNLFAI
jgi:hypothetical protein